MNSDRHQPGISQRYFPSPTALIRAPKVTVRCAVAVILFAVTVAANAKEPPRVGVVVGKNAPEIEQYAAAQLADYLQKLYGIQAQPGSSIPASSQVLFLVGTPATNTLVKHAAGKAFPNVSEQGIVLKGVRFRNRPSLIVAGGSPRATLWAVYELVERWGVRYLLHGDVLPEKAGELRLPDRDVVIEPRLTVRMWRVVNEHATGSLSWGMADYRPLLDQLAKLRFNRLNVNIWPHSPFLDYEYKGVRRHSASLFWGYHFPITGDTIGRQLFGNEAEFWNRDLPLNASYEELSAAGERLIHSLMTYGKQRGMDSVINANINDFPPDMAKALKSSQPSPQINSATIMPGADTPLDDPDYTGLATTILRALVNTYPEVSYVLVSMPEHREWVKAYEQAWQALDAKYGIEKIKPLAQVIAEAEKRTNYPGGAERAVKEVKGDIVNLYFYDRLLRNSRVFKGTRRPDMKFMYEEIAEELFPVLGRIFPPGSAALMFLDYTPSRAFARQEVMKAMPSRQIPTVMIFTLHDDNIGSMPQLELDPLANLEKAVIRYGWAGFSTRYWNIGDHDTSVVHISKAAWDPGVTAEGTARDQVRAVLGEDSVEDMLDLFREVEAATVLYEWKDLNFAFPVPEMLMKNWKAEPVPSYVTEIRSHYQRALMDARRAQAKCRPSGRGYVDYWVGRLEFGIGYLDTIEEMRKAAKAETEKNIPEAVQHATTALEMLRQAIEAQVRVARDRSDLGQIIVLNQFAYQPLQDKLKELKK